MAACSASMAAAMAAAICGEIWTADVVWFDDMKTPAGDALCWCRQGFLRLAFLCFRRVCFRIRVFVFFSALPGMTEAPRVVKEKMQCPVFLSAPNRENGNKREHKREQAFF
jgi:hypothetical protein